MLSLNGARQISGKSVRMSIFIQQKTSNAQRSTSNSQIRRCSCRRPWRQIFLKTADEDIGSYNLFDDLERCALAVTRCGAVQHGADRVNRLPVSTNNSADVALTQLHFEDRHFAARNFRQNHVVRKFHELSNDELEEFLHVDSAGGGGGGVVSAGAAAGSIRSEEHTSELQSRQYLVCR